MARTTEHQALSAAPAKLNRFNRAAVVDAQFIEFIRQQTHRKPTSQPAPPNLDLPVQSDSPLTGRDCVELLESQFVSRHQDITARQMRARQTGFYTIGSSGHEGNAVVGRFTRHTDPAFLHYRSGAFMAERSRQRPELDFIRDTMRSFAASEADPISGGRHKVWGSVPLNVPPQTSTIASHLPKAVGAALGLARAKRLGLTLPVPPDAIVVCSFGDASVNHAVAQTAFNAAAWAAFQHLPVPILFVCEDNGLGISVRTPPGWIEATFRARPAIRYFQADGLDLLNAAAVTQQAVAHCRQYRSPAFLHLKVVRLLAHAGSDPEWEYHTWDQIQETEARDPLLAGARLVIDKGLMTPDDVLVRYEDVRTRVADAAATAEASPKLKTTEQVMTPLAPYHPESVQEQACRTTPPDTRVRIFGGPDRLPENRPPRHMAVLINHALHDLLIQYPEAIVFGEDVARRGGVYHVTTGLLKSFGAGRVFNTLLDETTILGMGIGAAHLGLLPIPEIQYLAYYHNAEDQVRGEACSLQFFSNAQLQNPMVMRIAGWSYQKGFGGHFHNDNSIAVLRDVPSLIVATPARGDDAVRMLRTCLALAKVDGRVCAFIEPIALYMTRDLYENKDGQWQCTYPEPGSAIPLGEGRVYHAEASDLTIVTFANGLHMSLRAAKRLAQTDGIQTRVVDLRWLNPLNETFILEQARATGRLLVVDEGRRTGGVAEAVLAIIAEQDDASIRARRLNAEDCYIPLGAAADLVQPTVESITDAARRLARC